MLVFNIRKLLLLFFFISTLVSIRLNTSDINLIILFFFCLFNLGAQSAPLEKIALQLDKLIEKPGPVRK